MKMLPIWLLILLPLKIFGGILGDSLSKKGVEKMGFFDLNLGLVTSAAQLGFKNNKSLFNNYGLGISTRMQSSFIGNYLSNQQGKIRMGDILAGELAVGGLHQGATNRSDLGLAYSFEFGFATIASLSSKVDAGLTLTLLKFVRNRISPNVSGSNILLRFRYGRLYTEGGIESRRDRIFGWLTNLTTDSPFPVQYTFTSRYLLNNNRNFGARLELASASRDYILGELNYKSWWSLRLFYGIYF